MTSHHPEDRFAATNIEHDTDCPAVARGQRPAFSFTFTPSPTTKMGTIVVKEVCTSCPYRLTYVREILPLWRFARALTRTLRAYWITYGYRNELWDDAVT